MISVGVSEIEHLSVPNRTARVGAGVRDTEVIGVCSYESPYAHRAELHILWGGDRTVAGIGQGDQGIKGHVGEQIDLRGGVSEEHRYLIGRSVGRRPRTW